jgi:hypothetical protein
MIVNMEQSVEWLTGETEVLGETFTSAALNTTNPIRHDPVSNLVSRGGKPATNRAEAQSVFE